MSQTLFIKAWGNEAIYKTGFIYLKIDIDDKFTTIYSLADYDSLDKSELDDITDDLLINETFDDLESALIKLLDDNVSLREKCGEELVIISVFRLRPTKKRHRDDTTLDTVIDAFNKRLKVADGRKRSSNKKKKTKSRKKSRKTKSRSRKM